MTTETRIDNAFRASIRSVTDEVQIGLLRDALARGDVEAALEAIDLEPAAFEPLRNILVQTYADAGAQATEGLRGVRWNSASPRAEDYARNRIGTEITRITDDSLVAIRNHIADGYAFGRTPNRMALDLVGRIGPSGRREGGVVGLSSQQERWVSGGTDPATGRYIPGMRGKLQDIPDWPSIKTMTRRDRRFDAVIRRAYEQGKPLTQSQIDNVLTAYSNRLLLSRGRTIAVTERGAAINQGRVDAYKNAADKYGLPYSAIVKTWVHTGRAVFDRPTHQQANGQTVQGADTPFIIGGIAMQHPHDPFAPPGEKINCRCEIKLRLGNG